MSTIRVVIPTIYSPECPTIRSRLHPICQQLTRQGFEFTFFVIGNDKLQADGDVRYLFYGHYLKLILLVARIKKKDYDAIIASKPYSVTGVLSYLIARLRGLKYILDVDDRIFPSEIRKWWRVPLYVQEWCMERLLMLLRPSTIVASRGLQRIWGRHVVYIPNTVDVAVFSKDRVGKSEIRCLSNIPEGTKILIWPAVFFQETDRQYVLDIFEKLKGRSSIILLIIGNGEYLPEIRERVMHRGLNNVIIAGAVPYEEMPHLYARVDAGILPLRNNLYDDCKGPIKLYEYMSMELPVVATPVGEAKVVIEQAGCGVFIPLGDAERAAEIILHLCASPDVMREMGRRGRDFLLNNQTIERQAVLYAEMLELNCAAHGTTTAGK